ncbi:metal-dependent hydrolase [Undibacterium griseum]|uniref:Metal-dependent hydrolase n=1 Tax=Undibacterium griseum TaxID=2762295 RepID=A0ABR6YK34_9BURK|nr:metal-dependent hydrolase [Undibacterium griseum]MBC3884261.1 metal-dependent hydrolase [Undibacterium griseum]
MNTLKIRHLNIDLSQGFPRHWLGGDAFRTQLFNAQSMSFPLGEQYFIDSVRSALPLIRNDDLRAQIKGFIGQEATHRQMHAQYNAELDKQGLSYWIGPFVAWRIRVARRLSVRSNLAVTMAYEHFTAIFSDAVLGEPQWLADAAEPLRTVWLWHSAEETEHKSVAFDTYHAIGGGYAGRIAWFLYVTLLFSGDTLLQTMHNLYRDGSLWQPRTWWQGMKYCFGRNGLFRFSLPHYLAYFRPGFHPWDRDNLAQTQQWLNQQHAVFREMGTPE